MTSIRLENLYHGLPAITPAFGAFLAEAALVCLQNWGHRPGTVLMVNATPSQNLACSGKKWNQSSL